MHGPINVICWNFCWETDSFTAVRWIIAIVQSPRTLDCNLPIFCTPKFKLKPGHFEKLNILTWMIHYVELEVQWLSWTLTPYLCAIRFNIIHPCATVSLECSFLQGLSAENFSSFLIFRHSSYLPGQSCFLMSDDNHKLRTAYCSFCRITLFQIHDEISVVPKGSTCKWNWLLLDSL